MANRLFSDAQKTYGVSYRFTSTNTNKIIRLIENNPNLIRAKYQLNQPLWVNGFIEELYCFASIKSIPEIGIPPISQEDDEYVRLQKTLNYEWATARFELYLYAGNNKGTISELGRAALKNSQGYPYRRHRLIDLLTDNTSYLLGEGDWIGCKLDTFNLALGANDTITITGCWKQEIILVPEQQLISNVINVAASASPSPTPTPTPLPDITTVNSFSTDYTQIQVAAANTKRKSLVVKLTAGEGGTVYKVDDSNSSTNTYNLDSYSGQRQTPEAFFSGYLGRVNIFASPGFTMTVEVTEVSSA